MAIVPVAIKVCARPAQEFAYLPLFRIFGKLIGELLEACALPLVRNSESRPSPATLGVLGYLYVRTCSLWSEWAARTLTNSALNFVHVRSTQGLSQCVVLRMTVFVVVVLAGMIAINELGERFRLPRLQLWGSLLMDS